MDKEENINKIDPPKGNRPKGSDPQVYGNYVRGNFGKNRAIQEANLEKNDPKQFQRRQRMEWLKQEYSMDFDTALEVVRFYDRKERERMEDLKRKDRSLFEEVRDKKIKENAYYDIEILKEIVKNSNLNKS